MILIVKLGGLENKLVSDTYNQLILFLSSIMSIYESRILNSLEIWLVLGNLSGWLIILLYNSIGDCATHGVLAYNIWYIIIAVDHTSHLLLNY